MNRRLLSMSNFIYDILKEKDGEAFSSVFGRVFEKYIAVGLDYASCKYFSERELKKFYPDSLVVDYLLPFSDAPVLIESKGIEMSPLARVAEDARVVNNNLRNSVMKAIKQGFTLASQIKSNSKIPGLDAAGEFYLLIVTFKDLFLGNGDQFFRMLGAAAEIEEFIRESQLLPNSIAFNHIYLMSIREFEWLIYVSHHHGRSIPEILKQVVSADANPPNRKLQLGQHLAHIYGEIKAPEFVTEPAEAMVVRVASMLDGTIQKKKNS